MFGRFSTLAIALAFLHCLSCVASAEDTITEEAKALFEDVKEARSLLMSGKFRANGQATFTKPERSKPIILPSEIECMFDNEKKLLRMEFDSKILTTLRKVEDISSINDIRNNKDPKRFDPKPCAGFLLNNRDYSTSWYGIGIEGTPDTAMTNMSLVSPDETRAPRNLHYFDPAAVGLLDPRNFSSSKARSLKQILREYLKKMPVVNLEKGENGLVTVICQNEIIRGSITIDTQKGHTISRMTLQERDSNGRPQLLPIIESTGEWKQKDSVWIPTRFISEMKLRNGRVVRYTYDIDWIDINPEFNEQQFASLFTYKSFPELVWKNTHVFDTRPVPNGRKTKRLEHIDTIGAPFKQLRFADE